MTYCTALVFTPEAPIQKFQCLGLNLRTVKRIQNESNGGYEGMAAWMPHSDKKETPEFVGKIKVMIDYDTNKSIRSIARTISF